MERRKFLKASIFGFIGLLVTPKVFSLSDNTDEIQTKANHNDDKIPNDLIKFAEQFSKNYKKLKCGKYTSDCGKYKINYEHRLKDKTGVFIETPYRIGHTTGIMDFSKSKCVNMPQSFIFNGIIWCYAVTKLHPYDLVKSDLTAIKHSLENGFSKKEMMINYINTFKKTESENRNRINKINDFLKQIK